VRVTVTEIRGTAPHIVGFSSAAGSATGIWRGETPPGFRDYDVELEVPGKLRWGKDVDIDEGAPAGLRQFDGEGQIVARAVECDAAGVLSLELGGTIVMVELSNRPSADVAGATVSVRVQHLEIYPSMV
jgi:hypothetical protein